MYSRRLILAISAMAILFLASVASAENIDPYDDGSQYAYGENVGWFNFEPNVADPNAGATVSSSQLTGFIWAENIGWVSLSCENTASCGMVDYGVTNDGAGNLSGYAWGENVGWINFDPNYGGVTIDADGSFDGYAWGENIGWINFGLDEYYVIACKVAFEDLANFVDQWLDTVDFVDYSIFAGYWLDYCPDGWLLK